MYFGGGEQERKDVIKVTVVRIVEVEGKWECVQQLNNHLIFLAILNVPEGMR